MDRPHPRFLNVILAPIGMLLAALNRNAIAQRGARHQLHNMTHKGRVRTQASAEKIWVQKKRRRQIAKASRRRNRLNWW